MLSCSRGEKSGEGLGSKLHNGPEMVDSVRVGCEIKSGSGLGTRLVNAPSQSEAFPLYSASDQKLGGKVWKWESTSNMEPYFLPASSS